jgi:flagellar motor switch protein FliN/FliY
MLAALNAKAFDLLLDMEMPVSISFGSVQLPLRDVLKLEIGSSLDLNRSTGDPVDVLVNDRLIARGDVVMVDGNYGVKIREIVRRGARVDEDRLTQLAGAVR